MQIIEYSWQHEGVDSITTAVSDFYALDKAQLREKYPYILTIAITNKKGFAGNKVGFFDKLKLDRLYKKLLKQCEKNYCIYCGKRLAGSVFYIFFYCADQSCAQDLADMVDQKKFIADTEIEFDECWDKYYKNIYPNAAQKQGVQNSLLINALKAKGDDIISHRRVNHNCGFLDDINRITFEKEALDKGFATGDSYYHSELDYPNCAVIHKISTLKKNELDKDTETIINILEKTNGVYHYWDAKLVINKKVAGIKTHRRS